MSLDERLTALETKYTILENLMNRLITLTEQNQSRLMILDALMLPSKKPALHSTGLEPKRVSKNPGDREI